MERAAELIKQVAPILSAEEIRAAQAKDVLTSAEVCARRKMRTVANF